MELRRISLCLAFFVLAVISQCSEARIHNLQRRDADPGYDDYVQGDAAADDETLNDADGGDEEDEDILLDAVIRNQGKALEAKVGQSFTLKCDIDPSPKAGVHVSYSWEKDNVTIFMNQMKLQASNQVSLDPSTQTDLVITDFQLTDIGVYKCKVNRGEIKYTVNAVAAPKIINLSTSARGVVVEDSELTITCVTSGVPPPSLRWSLETYDGKGNHPLSEQDHIFGSNSVTIKHIKREQAGRYTCLADNKVGNPVVEYVNVKVVGKPRVHVHKTEVNTALNVEVILQCASHEEPPAEISWWVKGKPIAEYYRESFPSEDSSQRYTISTFGQSSNLTLIPTTEEEMGSYTCEATNQYGTHKRSIMLTRSPVVEDLFVEGRKVSWTVHSHQPIEKVNLTLKNVEDPSQRKEFDVPVAPSGHEYHLEYTIDDDELVAGRYEVGVYAKNTHGWSQRALDHTELMLSEAQPVSIQTAGIGYAGAASSLSPMSALLSPVIMYLLVRL